MKGVESRVGGRCQRGVGVELVLEGARWVIF